LCRTFQILSDFKCFLQAQKKMDTEEVLTEVKIINLRIDKMETKLDAVIKD